MRLDQYIVGLLLDILLRENEYSYSLSFARGSSSQLDLQNLPYEDSKL